MLYMMVSIVTSFVTTMMIHRTAVDVLLCAEAHK
jgi:hypothetical protein